MTPQFLIAIEMLFSHLISVPFETGISKLYDSWVNWDCSGSKLSKKSFLNKMPIDLYQIAPSPPCRAVIMTAQYLGIKLNKKHIDLFTGEHLKPEYIKMNPQHTVPTIDDDGFYLWESRTILTYFVNKYAPDSPIYPKDPQERAVVDRMLYFDIGTVHKNQAELTRPLFLKGVPAEPEKHEGYQNALKLFDELLGKTAYAAGDRITVADISLFATLTMGEVINVNFAKYPRIAAWMEKLKKEIPSHKEINEEPIQQLKEYLKSKK